MIRTSQWTRPAGLLIAVACVSAAVAQTPPPPPAPAPAPFQLPPTTQPTKIFVTAGRLRLSPYSVAMTPSLAKTVTAAYLGVSTRPVDEALAGQLELPPGVGLVVTYVDPSGPSATGLMVGDVLRKLGDQLLVDQHQLGTLIRIHKAGEDVTVSAIRKAKPVDVTVKLVAKEQSVVAADVSGDVSVEQTAGVETYFPTPGGKVPAEVRALSAFDLMTFDNGAYKASVTPDGKGHVQLIVIDDKGTQIANSPVDTDAQWEALPGNVKSQLKVLRQAMSGGLPDLPAPTTRPAP